MELLSLFLYIILGLGFLLALSTQNSKEQGQSRRTKNKSWKKFLQNHPNGSRQEFEDWLKSASLNQALAKSQQTSPSSPKDMTGKVTQSSQAPQSFADQRIQRQKKASARGQVGEKDLDRISSGPSKPVYSHSNFNQRTDREKTKLANLTPQQMKQAVILREIFDAPLSKRK